MRRQRRAPRPGSLLGRLAIWGMLAAMLVGALAAPVAAQPLPDDLRTIMVTGTGAATAPAETARIQFLIVSYGGMDMSMGDHITQDEAMSGAATPQPGWSEAPVVAAGPGPIVITEADLEPVISAMVAAGAPEDAITIHTGPAIGGYYGPGSPGYALVEILISDPTLEQVNAIVETANANAMGALAVQSVGVEYNVADCGPLLDAARQAAFDDARTRAEALSQHFGASVGAPVQVNDFGTSLLPLGGTGCPPTPDMAYGMYGPTPGFNTPPFNSLAPAEARVLVQLSVTYEFELASQ